MIRHKIKIRWQPIIFILLFFSSNILQAQLNLDSCQQKARTNYPLIMQYDLIEQTKDLSLSNANKAYLPKLDVTLIGGLIEGFPSFAAPGTTSSSSTEFNLISIVQLNQTIWDGGITKAQKGIIEASSEMETADISVGLYQLEDRVNNLYFGVLLIDEQIEQLDLLMQTLERNKSRIEVAVENGSAFKSDVDELVVEIINTKQKQSELLYNRQTYSALLAGMIGEEIPGHEVFSRPQLEDDIKLLSLHRPELRKFESQRRLIDAQSKLNKAMLIPKFGVLGFGVFMTPGVDFGASSLTDLYVAGLSVSWSLSPLYKNGNNKKLSEINLQRINNQQETFVFNTELSLSQTEMELLKLSKLIEQDKELLDLKHSIKEAYVVKYDNGVCTMSQMLDRINEESLAKQKMIMHEIQYLMAAYQYINKSGN